MSSLFGIVFEDPRHYGIFADPVMRLYDIVSTIYERTIAFIIIGVIALVAGYIYCSFVRRNPLTAIPATFKALWEGTLEMLSLLAKLVPFVFAVFVPAAWASGTLDDFKYLRGAFGINESNATVVQTTLWIVWGLSLLGIMLVWPSLQRVRAIAWLCFKEAIRGRILFVFLLFFAPFLFAGWYLEKTPEGALLYLCGFVNTAITFILMPMVILMVSMSLPNEIQARIVQTVVTKPVRRSEIVLGRTLGYIGVFSMVLIGMGIVSGFYIYGQLDEKQRATIWKTRKPVLANASPPEAQAYFEKELNQKVVLPPLLFKKDNKWEYTGTNVGKEWLYRYHVGGNDTAHYCFRFDPDRIAKEQHETLGEVCRVQFEFDVFKLTKGDPTREVGKDAAQSGVRCLIDLRDRSGNSTESYSKVEHVNHQRVTELVAPAKVFANGNIEAIIRCVTKDQFVGMAQGDMYILAKEGSFAQNFAKGLVSIWLKLIVLICVAVAGSTVLKSFVTVLLTFTIFILGIFWQFMYLIAIGPLGPIKGGGPIESFIRIVTQRNQVTELEMNIPVQIGLAIDNGLLWLMRQMTLIVPNLNDIEVVQYVAHGVDVPGALLLRNAIMVFVYVVPVLVIGYFLFRNRELAA